MNYKPLLCRNPQNLKDSGKFYPHPVYEKTIGLDDFVKEISHATSLTPTDVRAVVSELTEVFRRYLGRGHKVKLDGIGTFKVSFSGEGTLTAEELTAADIDRSTIRVTFVADPAMKQELRSGISFSKVAEKKEESKAEEKPAEDSGTQQD